MKEDRSLLKYVVFSILTLGIYSLFFWHQYANDMNIVCQGDGKNTRGILARILFDIITLGIYEFVWMYCAGERIAVNSAQRNVFCDTNGGNILLWDILGSFVIIGPLVATYKLIEGLNRLCAEYNRRVGANGAQNVTNIYISGH